MQRRVFLFCYQILAFYEVFRKSENSILWVINLALLSNQLIICNRNSVRVGRNKVCFDVNIEIMTQNCLKSRHYQRLFLKHRALASLNIDVSTYITKLLVFIFSVLKTKIYFE